MASYVSTVDIPARDLTVGLTAAQIIEQNGGLGSGGPVAQRIYDTGNSVWVYYAPSPIDAAPAIGDTTPNHSGTLDASSHQVI